MKHQKRKKFISLLVVLALVMSVFVVTPAPTVHAAKKVTKAQLKKKVKKVAKDYEKKFLEYGGYEIYEKFSGEKDYKVIKNTSKQYAIYAKYSEITGVRSADGKGNGLLHVDAFYIAFKGKINTKTNKITVTPYLYKKELKGLKKKLEINEKLKYSSFTRKTSWAKIKNRILTVNGLYPDHTDKDSEWGEQDEKKAVEILKENGYDYYSEY